jgi:hypothetical protein
MDIGQSERRIHNDIRNGTLDLFAALNVATGEILPRCKRSIARRISSSFCARSTRASSGQGSWPAATEEE